MTGKDRDRLRGLAARQKEVAHSSVNLERVELWKAHNALRGSRPMIHVEVDTFEQEAITPRLQCEDSAARGLEWSLLHNVVNLTEFDDDRVVPPYFEVRQKSWFRPFGFEITRTFATDSKGGRLGHRFDYVIQDLHDDFEALKPSVYGVDETSTGKLLAQAEEAFGDILPVRRTMGCLYAVPTQDVVHLMGMETMLFSMYDYPEEFTELMERLSGDYIAWFRWMEGQGLLLPTTSFEGLGQGSICFTDELPEQPVSTAQVWGFMDSQETVGISPEMFGEFIFPHYKRIADSFGLLSYGCCEPVHAVWEYVSRYPNLRKVSVSPWCDEEIMGERLRGSRTIFHRKPSPNFLGVDRVLDEQTLRAHIAGTLAAAKGCTLELTQRDVYTVHGDLDKVRRYVQIIREEIENHWKP